MLASLVSVYAGQPFTQSKTDLFQNNLKKLKSDAGHIKSFLTRSATNRTEYFNTDLDSSIMYYPDGTISSKSLHSYDVANRIETIDSYWDWVSFEIPSSRDIYEYDSNGEAITITAIDYYSGLAVRTHCEYDQFGYPLLMWSERSDAQMNTWVNFMKHIYQYNENNISLGESSYEWDINKKTWVKETETEIMSFYANGYPEKYEQRKLDFKSGNMVTVKSGTFVFNADGMLQTDTYKEYTVNPHTQFKEGILTLTYNPASMEILPGFVSVREDRYRANGIEGGLKTNEDVVEKSNALEVTTEVFDWDVDKNDWTKSHKTLVLFNGLNSLRADGYLFDSETQAYEKFFYRIWYYKNRTGIENIENNNAKAFIHSGVLHIDSDVAEAVTLYSVTGQVLQTIKKPQGNFSLDIKHLPANIVIAKGESGWALKLVK